MRRIPAREKFLWRGWEFKLSQANSTEAHWWMKFGEIQVRLIYRDIGDPETPPEFTAFVRMHGLEGSGLSASADLALALAENDFQAQVVTAVRLLSELRRGPTSV